MTQNQTLKGFRDFLPKQMAIREKVIGILKNNFEKYGFQPIQTPTLEYAEVLMGKYGEEADKLLYTFDDRGGRKVGLNYDLTVPTARLMAQYSGQIPLPFKRYQIQPSYRAENTQKGRYRQFTQCDVDTIGSSSPLSDAEIVAIISDSMTNLGLDNFVIRYNSRSILFSLIEKSGIGSDKTMSVLQTLDKLDKKTEDEVRQELFERQITSDEIKTLFELLKNVREDQYLKDVVDIAKKIGTKNLEFSPYLMRGLDYYTGPIFETVVKEPKIGSVTGGGRYDKLVANLGGPDLPAVGTTIGLDRICDVIEELKLWPNLNSSGSVVLITIFEPKLVNQSVTLTKSLRDLSINAEIYLNPEIELKKQLKYANDKGIPFVVLIGPSEISQGTIAVKNMQTGEQKAFKNDDLSSIAAYVNTSLQKG